MISKCAGAFLAFYLMLHAGSLGGGGPGSNQPQKVPEESETPIGPQ